MGNCIPFLNKETKSLPIDTIFKLPSPLPNWPSGTGEFGSGYIDLGGLKVYQIVTFNKVWAIDKGGPENLGATFYEPSPIPDGFSMFGCYCQPNNKPLFGWVLAGKDNVGEILKNPIDYTLVWSSESSKFKNKNINDHGYIWLPIPPEGYKALGHVVTTSPEKPALDKIQCVRSDLTDELEVESWVWGQGTTSKVNGINVHSVRPRERGVKAQGVSVGTFLARITSDKDDESNKTLSLACLKNTKFSTFSSMPNLSQIQALFDQYSPIIHFHPKEKYLPSSVNWYFANGALLYQKGQESNPSTIEPNGSNLPQDGPNDGAYWLDLPIDEKGREKAIKGDLLNSEVYLHIKPMLGATFTDIAVWIFYPFNGPGTAKLGLVDVPFGKIGEHVGDWEHVTLRISNFNGVLYKVYVSQHSGGTWLDAPQVEFQNGSNKVVVYSSLNGHAIYHKPGLVLQGGGDIGIRNDTAKSNLVLDCRKNYSIVAAENLEIIAPAWLNYTRQWGPKLSYRLGDEVKKIESSSKGNSKGAFEKLVKVLPNEVYGEEGPTGPKLKGVDLRSSKVCELGLLNYKAKHVLYPSERKKFRCHYDYYWASVFKVEYVDHSGQARSALAEAPNEALPSDCRPNFSGAWLTKDKFEVNKTYKCWYTLGISKVHIYQAGFFDCDAKDPSTIEMFIRYLILFMRILKSWYVSGVLYWHWRWEAVAGVIAGFCTSIMTVILFALLRKLFSCIYQLSVVRRFTLPFNKVRLRRVCFLLAYVSFTSWLAVQYFRRIGLPEIAVYYSM